VSTPACDATVLLSCGHESAGGSVLAELAPFAPVLPAGRALGEAVSAALQRTSEPVCVVPMTLGRDPRLVAESARALRWAGAESGHPQRVALTAPFATVDHLIGWLRAAALRFRQAPDEVRGLLIAALSGGPFDDAELFRIARLVRQYGRHQLVEVAIVGGDPDVAAGVERLARLGADRVGLISAGFGPIRGEFDDSGAPIDDAGALLGTAMLAQVVTARVAAALHGLGHGDDGIAAGLHAEHGHGYAHSHHDHTHHH
jgi:sirohydrochlorin cobaltochelatase